MIVKPTQLQSKLGWAGLGWSEAFVCLASSISVPQIDGCTVHLCIVLPPVEVNLLAKHVLPLQLGLPLPLIGCIRHGARGALRLRLGL